MSIILHDFALSEYPDTAYTSSKRYAKRGQMQMDMLLICSCRKEGKSIHEIEKVFGQAYSTIRDWLIRADQVGLDRLYVMPINEQTDYR